MNALYLTKAQLEQAVKHLSSDRGERVPLPDDFKVCLFIAEEGYDSEYPTGHLIMSQCEEDGPAARNEGMGESLGQAVPQSW